MSRADGSAYPPLPFDSDYRAARDILNRKDGEWSLDEIIVGEHVHLVAKCFCASCMAIREEQDERDFRERPQHRYFGKCSLPVGQCEVCDGILRDLARMADEEMSEHLARQGWRNFKRPEET